MGVAAGPPLYADRAAARRHIGELSWLSHQLAEGRAGAQRVCQFTCAHRRLAGTLGLLGRRHLPRAVVFDGVRHTWASYSETFASFLLDAPPESWMQGVQSPVRLLAGANDPVVDPTQLSAIVDRYHQVTFTQVPSADHDLPIAHPDRMLMEMSALKEWVRCD